MGQEACKRKIRFTGYQYLGAQNVPGQLDKTVAEFQFNNFIKKGKWLKDEQAKELIHKCVSKELNL